MFEAVGDRDDSERVDDVMVETLRGLTAGG
jgi:hypothetical protein